VFFDFDLRAFVPAAGGRIGRSAVLALWLTGCGSEPGPPAGGEPRRPEAPAANQPAEPAPADPRRVQETRSGPASYISSAFHGKKTASGETYDEGRLVAAHPSYPLGTTVRITNLENGRVVEVRVIDRSASVKNARSPIIDVSRAAAERLGFLQQGSARVRTEVLE
jgi:rare lipoprotein A